jgi:hypothetical protein
MKEPTPETNTPQPETLSVLYQQLQELDEQIAHYNAGELHSVGIESEIYAKERTRLTLERTALKEKINELEKS